MNYLNKLERKIGKYAIPNLSLWLVVTYALGYLMMYMTPGIISYLMLEPAMVLRGQVWRLVTWVLIPPSTGNIFFYIIMIMLYYSLGTALERTWGTFRFNVYIFGGMIFTVIGAFVAYGFLSVTGGLTIGIGYYVTTYYINMAIFLAFAVCFPNMQILLWFIIPVRMKWMAYVYAALTIYDFVTTGAVGRISIAAALLNFLIFYLSTRNYQRVSPKEYTESMCSRHRCGMQMADVPVVSQSINVRSAEERRRMIRLWNSVSVQNVTEIMNTVRIICLPMSILSGVRDYLSIIK